MNIEANSRQRGKPLVKSGNTLFDLADDLALEVPTSCGRTGRCHECIVEVNGGAEALNDRTEAETFLRGNYRLACQAIVLKENADVSFRPLRRRPRILTTTLGGPVRVLDPPVCKSGNDVLYGREIIDSYHGHIYGLAIDLGTTTVAVELVDLETGASLQVSSFENPQRFGGSDVMHRISYATDVSGSEMQRAIIAAVNQDITHMCRELNFRRREIYEIVVAGNATMRDLFFGRDVQSIGQKPYKSQVELEWMAGKRPHTALLEMGKELGIRANRNTRVYGLPLIASHVGGDVAADLLAAGMFGTPAEPTMLVDVGTNTEVVVANNDRIVCASCPAGPAFEGGGIKYGMPGYPGAIESIAVRADGRALNYRTIDDLAPQGLCGSGLIDLLASLRMNSGMGPLGTFTHGTKHINELIVVPEFGITFSREDASNLAQAKAANYCGQYIVLRACGLNPGNISKLYLAGGFANYVNTANAVRIGFLPPVPEERIVKIGNASLRGAREVLLSASCRSQLEHAVKRVEHIELETVPDFFEVFVEGCQFKPMPSEILTCHARAI
jgi:uncharacterized 2Fe-2S/4Fe-4S cluster protein (DUF4445 family)